MPVQLPGRENRITEPPAFTIGEIADEIAPATGEPYALYGHSMGARVAFEVTRELRRRGLPGPALLFAGGGHPPHRKVPLAATADLPDDAFIDQLVRRAGAQPELKHEPELRDLLLPVLRADFAWIKRYRYEPEPPLGTPIVALTGVDDGEVGVADLLGWARHTTAGFRLRTMPGGHLFVQDRPADVAAVITADLAGTHPLPGPGEIHLWLATGEDHAEDPVAAVLARYEGKPEVASCRAGDLVLVAAAQDRTPGVALAEPRRPGTGTGAGTGTGRGRGTGRDDDAGRWLGAGEREQVEGAAEQDRDWLELRAVTAKRALVAATGIDPADAEFDDLADPAPWRVAGTGDLAGWRVVHLPLPTPRGEVQAAVAAPHDRVRLRLDTLPDRAG